MRARTGCEPFLKWPGGKRWAAPLLAPIIDAHLTGHYFEPFLGAGAVFLRLQPSTAVLTDINSELISCFKTVALDPEGVIRRLSKLTNDRECYYRVRASKPTSEMGAAVRFLYLNKTAWGGVYRLNQRGEFNVPFGNSGREIVDKEQILEAAAGLRRATLVCEDFEVVMSKAAKGDVVYADPPYSLPSNEGSFLRYNDKIFCWKDQNRLAKAAKKAARNGAKVIVSGFWDEDFVSLYPNWYAVKLARQSNIARKSEARGIIYECLVFSFDPYDRPVPLESLEALTIQRLER